MKIRSLLIVAALGSFADSISASNQAISNNSVTASSVTATKAGYVVVHPLTRDTLGRVLGVAPVAAGENSNVSVSLTATVKAGSRLIFILHEESNGDTFDPRDKFVFVNGKLVTKTITVLK
jgi:hypothetical protein